METPITDALLESLKLGLVHKENALIDHARQLEVELAWSAKRWKAAMEERDYYEKRCHELHKLIPGSGSEH